MATLDIENPGGEEAALKAAINSVLGFKSGTLASELSLQNDTLIDATGMAFTIGSSATEIWFVEAFLRFFAANATMDIKVGWTGPTAATMNWGVAGVGGGSIAGFGGFAVAASPIQLAAISTALSQGSLTGGVPFGYKVQGWVFGGGTAGTIQLQFAQNTTDANNLTIKSGSFLRALKLVA